MITVEELLTGIKSIDVVGYEKIVQFVVDELNEALRTKTPLTGDGWVSKREKCGCLISAAAVRRGFPLELCDLMSTSGINRLATNVGIDSSQLRKIAVSFVFYRAEILAERGVDYSTGTYGVLGTIGARAYLLFQKYGGEIRID